MSRAVAVTGAAGFIGGHVVEALLSAGHAVVAVDRRPLPDHLPEPSPAFRYLRTDLTGGSAELTDVLASADAVLHLAGCPGVRDARPDVEHRRHRDNVLATGLVLAATPLRTPVVVTSSSSVYGGTLDGRPCQEDDALEPRGGYARSKQQVERLCALRRDGGGSVTVARPFTVAGERQRPDMALSVWLDDARAGRPLTVLGSRARTRDVTDVRQVARALVALAEVDPSTTVNVGTGRAVSLGQLADAVRAVTGADVPDVVVPAADVEPRHTLACTARLRSLVGFAPVTDLTSLVARQAAAAAPSRVVA